MKIFTATPEEFGNGKASIKAADLFRGRELRKKPAPHQKYRPGPSEEIKI
jgi:hypothetical protein